MTAKLVAFQIFLTHFAVAADGDFSGGGRRRGGGEGVEIFLGAIEVLYFEPEMIQARHQAAVRDHAPGADDQVKLAVRQVKTVIPAEIFRRLELENFSVELGDMSRPAAADGDVIDPARLFP